MPDTRFSTLVDDPEALLDVVDVDDVGDIETLLMFLFARPVRVDQVWDDQADATALEVVMTSNDEAIGTAYEFPLSVMGLARACAETADDLGVYTRDGFASQTAAPAVSAMSDTELITALQQALGQVRFFNMMGADE
ncbi:hypothetical protein [Pimelobacter simplex]|uniref:hypothetical protein n=1 Tax=Nocardioides simplex TaxID=2045 RepID=UPI00215037DF|nr:hypothetical protein [Pimelobacter simplex]UUW92951.1 hypothetical protein M0M43_30065 [Pimelobacter simplex]UUW98984.1 hypothetical protein M0M48_30085 [Pimelobacter simplex]